MFLHQSYPISINEWIFILIVLLQQFVDLREKREIMVGLETEIAGALVEGSVTFLLQKIDAIATREWNLKQINRMKVQDIGRELGSIEALLQADSKEDPDHRYAVWIQQVRDQANAIEDVLDRVRLAEGQCGGA